MKNGPWGGTTSDKLHDFNPNLSVRLNSVTVIYYRALHGLHFNYINQHGYENTSELFGNNGFGGSGTKRVSLDHHLFPHAVDQQYSFVLFLSLYVELPKL